MAWENEELPIPSTPAIPSWSQELNGLKGLEALKELPVPSDPSVPEVHPTMKEVEELKTLKEWKALNQLSAPPIPSNMSIPSIRRHSLQILRPVQFLHV